MVPDTGFIDLDHLTHRLLVTHRLLLHCMKKPSILKVRKILYVIQSIELPTKQAVRHNQVWCGTLSDFDELIICVERTERIEYKARSQVQGIQSAEPTTVAEYKQLNDVIRDIQSDARAAERYLRIGTGTQTKRLS